MIYAHDELCAEHTKARTWWENVLSGSEPIGLPWVVLLAFTRLMTHPQICRNPLGTEDVRSIVDQWFASPNALDSNIRPGTTGIF
ncbi:MAG: hypothetical protein AAGH40_01595 [Verrucomicrobiota bacterium]